MNFEDIVEEWKVDCVIDPTDMVDELTKTAKLQSKYLGYMGILKGKKKIAEQQLAKLKREKIDYYRGRAEGKVSPLKIVAAEVDIYINSDDDIQEAEIKVEATSFAVWYLEKVVKQIESRSWEVRSTADWLKYIGGR